VTAAGTPAAPPSGVRGHLQSEGVGTAGRTYLWDRTDGLMRRLFRRHLRPSLNEFYQAAQRQEIDPVPILAEAFSVAPDAVRASMQEARSFAEPLTGNRPPDLRYPEISRMTLTESLLVYAMVRLRPPETVLETGVANGQSTAMILEAMRRNGKGRLYSVDVSDDVGGLVPAELRSRWTLKVLSRRDAHVAFGAFVQTLPAIDLFIHDSDHTYPGQWREYSAAWNHLSPSGLLASDDVDWSYAFLDFGRSVQRRPFVLVTDRKAFGFLPRAGTG